MSKRRKNRQKKNTGAAKWQNQSSTWEKKSTVFANDFNKDIPPVRSAKEEEYGRKFSFKTAETNSIFPFVRLPGLVLQRVCSFLDDQSLLQLHAALGVYDNVFAKDWNAVWQKKLTTLLGLRAASDSHKFTVKDRFIAAKMWERRKISAIAPFYRFRERFMPWLLVQSDNLYFSAGNRIEHRSLSISPFRSSCEKYQPNHLWNQIGQNYRFIGNQYDRWSDICRFAVDEHSVVAATYSGSILVFDNRLIRQRHNRRNLDFWYKHEYCAHSADVQDVDLKGDTVVSASRDHTVKVWQRTSNHSLEHKRTLNIEDRAYCAEISPALRTVAVGSSACGSNWRPLTVWDLESGIPVAVFDRAEKKGSAVVDVKFMQNSDSVISSAGLDSALKLWDLRSNQCVWRWDEPCDRGLMCLATDNNYSMVAGARRNSAIWILDTRLNQRLTGYFLSLQSSPVYSVAFTTKIIYGALDRALISVEIP